MGSKTNLRTVMPMHKPLPSETTIKYCSRNWIEEALKDASSDITKAIEKWSAVTESVDQVRRWPCPLNHDVALIPTPLSRRRLS